MSTDGRTLPWRVVGRAVKPYAFAVSLATSVSVWSVATDRAVGALLDGLPGAVIAAYGVIAVALLWLGFWGRRDGVDAQRAARIRRVLGRPVCMPSSCWSRASP